MNFLKKGPELKLPEIKVPGFVRDLYLDLKERHLLPVAAVLLVGIVAVPLMFGHSSDSPKPSTAEGQASISSETATASRALVARSTPGLRRYQQRLDHLRAKDPFKPRAAEPESEPEAASSESSSSASSSETGGANAETSAPSEASNGSTGTSAPTGGSETSSGTGSESTPAGGHLRYFSYAIDVRVATGGDSEQGAESRAESGSTPESSSASRSLNWTSRHNLPELTMLPSRGTPAIVYMGSTKDAKKALMLVSSDVTAIFGDAKCVIGTQTCQLLAMEPGVPETFVYGPAGRTFKIELVKVHLVETKKLNVAPLGNPKTGRDKNGKSNP